MGILIPEGNLTSVITVGSQLVDDKVGINSRVNEVVTIGCLGNSPSEIGLMAMSVSVPDAEFGVVMGGTTMHMSNSVRGKLGDNKHLLSASGEVVWIFIWSGVDGDETPVEIRLIDVLPLGDGCVISSLGTIQVNTASGVNKGNCVPTSTNITEVNLQVPLVSMGILIPERDFSPVVAVGTKLMQYEVRIDGRTQVVIATVSGSKGPLQV